jgi:hypothetical protein
MRAVWVGLVGVLLTAKSTARWSSEISRPDLIGRTFSVEKVSSRWRAPKVAEISLLVKAGTETFVVQQVSDFTGAPVDTIASTQADARATQSVQWGDRSKSAEAKHYSGTLDGIASGPLTSLSLIAKPCS